MTEVKARKIAELLKQTTSIPVIAEFLKSKDLHHSANKWDDLINKRLIPNFINHKISLDELSDLLKDVEEHGKQHIFFYSLITDEEIDDLLNLDLLKEKLAPKGLEKIMEEPLVLDQPDDFTISDIRYDSEGSLIIKFIGSFVHQELASEEIQGEYFVKKWKRTKERAVHILRLNQHGQLEMRIASHRNSSDYGGDIKNLWEMIDFLLPQSKFTMTSLSNLKDRLWSDRETLSDIIKYTETVMRDEFGCKVRASVGSDKKDLLDNNKACDALEVFAPDSDCDSSNISFKQTDENELNSDIRVILTKDINELVIPANCNKQEYEYILYQVRSINKQVS